MCGYQVRVQAGKAAWAQEGNGWVQASISGLHGPAEPIVVTLGTLFYPLSWAGAQQAVRLGETPVEALLSHLVLSQAFGANPSVASTLLATSTQDPKAATQVTHLGISVMGTSVKKGQHSQPVQL